jgi:transposase-like protein
LHTPEFRLEIVERMLSGESVIALAGQYRLARSMMYRWREAYRLEGAAGLARTPGRSPGRAARPQTGAGAGSKVSGVEQRLRQKVSELERKVGQQAVEIDFFKGVFKRLEELPKAKRRGGDASTPRS